MLARIRATCGASALRTRRGAWPNSSMGTYDTAKLRQQIVAPLRGVIDDLGKRTLALPPSARLGFQIKREANGRSDDGFAGVSLVGHGDFLFSIPEHAVRKGRGDHPTEERNRGPEAVNPTQRAAISRLRAPRHPSLLALELPARLDHHSPIGRAIPAQKYLIWYYHSIDVKLAASHSFDSVDVASRRTGTSPKTSAKILDAAKPEDGSTFPRSRGGPKSTSLFPCFSLHRSVGEFAPDCTNSPAILDRLTR
jgi:hypothetical protein